MNNNNQYVSPELVHLSRGEISGKPATESIHRGEIVVVDGNGTILYAIGDANAFTHLRSTAKPFQLLPFMNRNLDAEYGLDEADVALFMGSHGGEDQHLTRLESLLQKLNIDPNTLLCGIHAPTFEPAKSALITLGRKPNVLHNNCSGKHCALIAASRKAGWSLEKYTEIGHPLQKEIADILLELSGASSDQMGYGIDGCSAATFILPLVAMARLYATLAFPSHATKHSVALQKIFSAGTAHPEMVAGTRRLDTMLMRLAEGRVFAKTGAEGVYAIAVAPFEKYPKGLGVAIKISDGDLNHRARNVAVLSLLIQLEVVSRESVEADSELGALLVGKIKNFSGNQVGEIKSVFVI